MSAVDRTPYPTLARKDCANCLGLAPYDCERQVQNDHLYLRVAPFRPGHGLPGVIQTRCTTREHLKHNPHKHLWIFQKTSGATRGAVAPRSNCAKPKKTRLKIRNAKYGSLTLVYPYLNC